MKLSTRKRVNLLFIIIFYEVILNEIMEALSHEQQRMKSLCQGPQRIGNLEYGTTETLAFHTANEVQDVGWVNDRRFLAIKEDGQQF